MTSPIRVLHLEDSPRDAEIVQHRLGAEGLVCEVTLATGRHSFESALDRGAFDLIFCDHNLPDYDGFSALALARARQPEAPVLIISGTLDEEAAVQCLHLGATDYLLKQRLERLGAAVRRALAEAAAQRQRRAIEEALRLDSAMMANMAEGVGLIRASDGVIIQANPQFERLFGYGPAELIGRPVAVLNAPSDKSPEEMAQNIIAVLQHQGVWSGEIQNVRKDGTPFWCRATVSTFQHATHGTVWVAVHQDITERKRAEAERERLIAEREAALNEVKVLRGLLPICAGCKRIRDDKNQWRQLESYIGEHSEAQFSHGLCPECIGQYYPELAAQILNKPLGDPP